MTPTAPAALSTAASTRFVGSGACGSCHRFNGTTNPATNVDLASGEVIGIVNDWAGTMMANAARDPLYLAAVTAEMAAVPGLSTLIQTKCLTCHAPMASYEARQDGVPFGLAELPVSPLGLDGVSCALCHRIEEGGLGTEASFSGNFVIGNETGSARRIHGPLENVATNPMIVRVLMTPVFAEHISESRPCGSCHTLRTPTIDPSTQAPTGASFPEQMTYKEWLNSSHVASGSCQSCHVPRTAGNVRLSTSGPTRGLTPFGKHHLVGANAFMLQLMRQDRAGANVLQLAADTSNFDAAIARTVNGLTQATATLGASACRDEASLKLDVKVANRTGHKLPTAFPSRRMWLHTRVVDALGATVFESGAFDAAGEIVGLDAGYEPHHQTIRQPDQVQVYEAVMGDNAGRMTARLLYAARYLKDNRLLPDGIAQDVADAEIRPVGINGDADFGSGQDTVVYSFGTGGFRPPFTIEVELLYQSAPPRMIDGLSRHASDEIARFMSLYAKADTNPRRVAALRMSLQ